MSLWAVGAALTAPFNVEVGSPPPYLGATTVRFRSASGATIAAWYSPPIHRRATVIISHGVRGSRAQIASRSEFIWKAGYGVLLYDAQGHGESTGESITFGFLEARDAAAAVDFARRSDPSTRVGFIGPSLAGASALLGSVPLPVDALVLEAVYPTLEQAVVNRISLRVGKFPAFLLSRLLLWQVEPRMGFDPFALNPIDRIASAGAPILLIAGSEDRHTTIEESRALFNAARSPKELWVVEGAAHESFHRFAGHEYERRILEFFEDHLQATVAQQGVEPDVE